jgi:hypothetical protein
VNFRQDGYAKAAARRNQAARLVAPITILAVLVALTRIVTKPHRAPHYPDMPKNAVRLEENVGLSINLQRALGKNFTMGPHEATLVIAKPCKDPRFVLRLVGDEAIISAPIVQLSPYLWKGEFQVPFPGSYIMEPRWYGCEVASPAGVNTKGGVEYKGESTKIMVSGVKEAGKMKPITQTHSSMPHLFPEGFWATPKLYADRLPNVKFWVSRAMGLTQPHMLNSASVLGASAVAKEATPVRTEFGELSNYELLCWVGSHSADIIWESFKSLRDGIAKHQKPFKFHYYPMDSFEQPDRDWTDENKLRFRKCKNLIISVDELKDQITQEDYKHQVAIFLGHLVKAFDDASFPIWMLTVNLSPVSSAAMCTSPKLRTNHHPCNDALFELFDGKSLFPERVRLLDNTDLTSPLLDEGLQDAVAIIAMRIYAIAGDQVRAWRKAGQKGTKDGLQRNGKLEPNIDYPVYNFNS